MQVHRARSAAQPKIEHFDKHREAHGEIDVAFWNMNSEAINHERQADEQEETQGKHLDRWMFRNKAAHGRGKEHHENDGHNDG